MFIAAELSINKLGIADFLCYHEPPCYMDNLK